MGAIVFAGCLHSDGPAAKQLKEESSKRLHILQMDVTNDSQVKECAEYVNKALEGTGMSSRFLVLVEEPVLLVRRFSCPTVASPNPNCLNPNITVGRPTNCWTTEPSDK
jgi:hypothetical protein